MVSWEIANPELRRTRPLPRSIIFLMAPTIEWPASGPVRPEAVKFSSLFLEI